MSSLHQILLHDIGVGKNFNPQRALDFLKTLEEPNRDTPPAKKLEALLENPPNEDQTLHIIYKTPFVQGEIVLAGRQTRKTSPLCASYPVHFKKTYLQKLSRWETQPAHEAKVSQLVWAHFEEKQNPEKPSIIPLPLSASPTTYRSELLEAKTLGTISPIHNNNDPADLARQIQAALEHPIDIPALWTGVENLNKETDYLHSGGFLHHDLHRENLLLRASPEGLQGCLIDFETTEEDERFGTLSWPEACKEDKRFLLEEAALILLCAPEPKKIPSSHFKEQVQNLLRSQPKLRAIQTCLNKQRDRSHATPPGIGH